MPALPGSPSLSLVRGDALFRPRWSVSTAVRSHARWIERRPLPENDLLSRTGNRTPSRIRWRSTSAVARMRTVPIGRKSLLAILAPALVPMIVVVALQIPVKELLLSVLKALT